MNKQIKSRYWYALISLAIAATVLGGCASPNTKDESSRLAAEEAYIDLKHRFSMVLPATWQRKKTPVSSPGYRPDTVRWIISEPNTIIGSLEVRTQSLPTKPPLQETLSAFLYDQTELTNGKTKPFQHLAGPALRLNGKDPFGNVIYLAIEGLDRTYIIAFNIKETDFKQLLPLIEKVILSFSIL